MTVRALLVFDEIKPIPLLAMFVATKLTHWFGFQLFVGSTIVVLLLPFAAVPLPYSPLTGV